MNISELLGEKATTVSAQGIQNLAKNLESSTGSSWGGSEFCKFIPMYSVEIFYVFVTSL